MANTPLQLEPLSLAPIDAPSRSAPAGVGAAAPASASPAERPPSPEEVQAFLATAQRELDTGWIDRPLWESVLAQSKGDEARARTAYLQTRATVLQLEKRDRRPEMSAPPAPARAAAQPKVAARDKVGATKAPRRSMPKAKVLVAGATAVVLLAAGIGFAIHSSNDGSTSVAASVSVPRHAVVAARKQAAAADPTVAAQATTVDDGLNARITKMVEAGNWNVVTLLASEWTRREPANALAWLQLGDGYMRLHEWPEALDAVTKATQLASGNAQAWRTLGRLYMQLDRPSDALQALDKAVALDANDVQTLSDVGTLNAQLAHLAEAKAAFDKVLAADPDDANAACGQAFIAHHQGNDKEASAIERALQAHGQSCAAWNQRAGAVNVASGATVYKPVPAAVR